MPDLNTGSKGSDMSARWYYILSGLRHGPVNEELLKEKYLYGEIKDDTFIQEFGKSDWIKAKKSQLFENDAAICLNAASDGSKKEAATPDGKRVSSKDSSLLFSTLISSLVTFLLCYGIWWTVANPKWCWTPHEWKMLGRILFGAYVLLFAGMWSAYFLSRYGSKKFQIATLRRILMINSVQWNPFDVNNSGAVKNLQLVETSFQDKAKTSMTATSILMAASILELAQANFLYNMPKGLDSEQTALVVVGAVFAFLALVCFLIAVDSLDAMLNSFGDSGIKHNLLYYFYRSSINPRYYGFVLLLSGAVFLTSVQSLLLGTAFAGIVMAVGYSHWFPGDGIVFSAPSINSLNLKKVIPVIGRLLLGGGLPLWLMANEVMHRCS